LNGTARLIRIIHRPRVAEGNDGQLNTEVIVRGIVVPGYSYVNLDQASLLEVKRGKRERRGEGGDATKREQREEGYLCPLSSFLS